VIETTRAERRSRGRVCGFAQLTVAGRDEGAMAEVPDSCN